MAETEEKTRFHFDVVNSVKGGSGKSFFALQLAAFHALKGRAAYIIDLDLRGTSWEPNYENYITPHGAEAGTTISQWKSQGHDYPYIEKLMWHYENYKFSGIWSSIQVQDRDGHMSSVQLCIAEVGNYHRVDQLEEDLFENTIFQITRDIRIFEENKERDVHIILDMPPSYERHAQRVLTHMLLSTNSQFEDKDDALDDKLDKTIGKDFDYKTTIFMMETPAPAHFIQNAHYIRSLFEDRQYSSCVKQRLEKGSLRIVPVINDVMGVISETVSWETVKETTSAKRPKQWNAIKIGKIGLEKYITPELHIDHLSLKSITNYYGDQEDSDRRINLDDSPKLQLQSLE